MEQINSVEHFDEIIKGRKGSIVKFYADWCPDCVRLDQFIGPIMEEFHELDWYELNRDDFPEIAETYDVMGIPSLLVFQNGEKIAHLHSANAKTPQQVKDFLSGLHSHVIHQD